MYVIAYRLTKDGHLRLRVKHGAIPYDTRETAQADLDVFLDQYTPDVAYLMRLVDE